MRDDEVKEETNRSRLDTLLIKKRQTLSHLVVVLFKPKLNRKLTLGNLLMLSLFKGHHMIRIKFGHQLVQLNKVSCQYILFTKKVSIVLYSRFIPWPRLLLPVRVFMSFLQSISRKNKNIIRISKPSAIYPAQSESRICLKL